MLELKFENGQGNIALEKDRLSIGRDAGNDIVFEDSRVSGFHANIIKNIDKFEIVDLGSSNGTFLNGEFIKGRRILKAWDKIVIGGATIEVVDTAGRRPTMVQAAIGSPAAAVGKGFGGPHMKLISSGNHLAHVALGGPLTIGRAHTNSLILDSPTISGSHAEIRLSGGLWELVDKGSTNGTFVNGQKVTQAFLRHGDTVAFDQIEYLFQDSASDVAKTMVNPALYEKAAATVVSPSVSSSAATVTGPSPVVSAPKIRSANELLGAASGPGHTSEAPKFQMEAAQSAPSSFSEKQFSSAPAGSFASTADRLKWLYFSTDGRIPRLTFFLGCLGMAVALIPVYGILYALLGSNAYRVGTSEYVINLAVSNAAMLYPIIALYAKRLHDLGRSAQWVWIALLSVLGSFIVAINQDLLLVGGFAQLLGAALGIYVFFFKGNAGPNQYGHPYQPAKKS